MRTDGCPKKLQLNHPQPQNLGKLQQIRALPNIPLTCNIELAHIWCTKKTCFQIMLHDISYVAYAS